MIRMLIDGIAATIAQKYPDCEVYKERMAQGIRAPCFYVHCIEIGQRRELMGRFFRSQPFQVVYFPENRPGRDGEMLSVLSELLILLGQIMLPDGNVVNGSRLSGSIVDNTAVATVNYDLFYREMKEETPMEGVEIKGGLNNE